MLGLYENVQGNIIVNGQNIHELNDKEKAKIFSYVPQNKEMVDMTCFDFILSGCANELSIFDHPSNSHKEKVLKVMKEMNIESFKDQMLDTCSGGEKQLMYIARAFVQDAQMILLDEPCAHLDIDVQHQVLKYLQQYVKKGKIVLITTHDPSIAFTYANRIIMMKDKMIYADIKDEMKDYKTIFINKMNELYDCSFELIQDKILYYKEAKHEN